MTKYKPKNISEALGWVAEECGEVIAAIGKTMRHGLSSTNPDLKVSDLYFGETNEQMIKRELKDLGDAVQEMYKHLLNPTLTVKP